MTNNDCIFCQLVAGTIPSHKIWEDDKHLAFLSIFPNTEGFSVVIPKAHHDSYFAVVPETVAADLLIATQKVAQTIDATFPDVGRTGLMLEGFGVNHLHAKLFPMHGTADDGWKKRASSVDKYFTEYEGYMSSHDFVRADDSSLAALAERIRGNK